MKIKAIIPAAGMGTRFLPATKNLPKEMLPIVDKPAIHYIVQEGVSSGIEDFIMVTNKNKNCLEDYFDKHQELEYQLKKTNKDTLLDPINNLLDKARFIYVKQQNPLGLGHALLSAKHVVHNQPVAIFLPDDIFFGATPTMRQLIKVAQQEKCNVIAVQEVPLERVSSYGIISVRKQLSSNLFQIKDLVEKPNPLEAPSNIAILGRYVLSPTIFDAIESVQPGANGEIQLTDAIQELLLRGEKVFALKISNKYYDTGNPLGMMKANIDFALRDERYSQAMLCYLKNLDKERITLESSIKELSL